MKIKNDFIEVKEARGVPHKLRISSIRDVVRPSLPPSPAANNVVMHFNNGDYFCAEFPTHKEAWEFYNLF